MEEAGLMRERGEKMSRKSTAGLRVGCFEGGVRSCTPIFHTTGQRRSSGIPIFLKPQRRTHYELFRIWPQ
jgi:hypothetical protein